MRSKAAIAAIAAALAGLAGCGGSPAAGDGSPGGGGGAGAIDVGSADETEAEAGAACQKIISNSEIASITGVGDLAFDPTGSVVNLDHVRICPYQNAAGVEVIVTVHTGPAYGNGFTMVYQIAKDSPAPTDVPGLGNAAVWVEYAHQLFVDLGAKGLQVDFVNKPSAVDAIVKPKDKAVAIAKVVVSRI